MRVRPLLVLALALSTLLPAQSPHVKSPHHLKSRKVHVMEITFTRSGGFAGAATEVTGTIHFDPAGAHVTAEGTTYRHDLPAPEARHLQTITTAQLAKPAATAAPSPTRDGFQYDVLVKTNDGKQRALPLEAVPDGNPDLSAWIQQEIQKIWEYRIANRPK